MVKTYCYNSSQDGEKSVLNNNTINKAGPTGPSFVAPGLLFSRVVRCHKNGLGKIAIGSEQGSTAGPWMYTES